MSIERHIFKSFEEAGINVPVWAKGQVYTTCPKCTELRKRQNQSKKSLSVNVGAKVFNCHHCEWHGRLIEDNEKERYHIPEVIQPRTGEHLISDGWKVYLQHKRGLNVSVCIENGCFNTTRKFNKDGEVVDVEVLAFPYTSPKGDLLFYKFRGLGKEFSSTKAPKYVFWNLHTFKSKKVLIVNEGEFDALAWLTAFAELPDGWEVPVSDIAVTTVPNGAVKRSGGSQHQILNYFERCIDFIKHFEIIYLAVDNDEAGVSLKDELARRFGKDICKIVRYTPEEKDANGTLLKDGAKGLQNLFNEAKYYPIEGVTSANEFADDLLHELGTERLHADKIGLEEHDTLLTFDRTEGLTLVTGAPNSSKSDYMMNIMIRLSLLHGWKWLITTPETGHAKEVYKEFLVKLVGKSFHVDRWRNEVMSKDDYVWGMNFLEEHIKVIESTRLDKMDLEEFLNKAAESIKKHGINGFVIDPFNSLDGAFSDGNMSVKLNEDLSMAQMFIRKHGVHLFIAAHPKAMVSQYMTDFYSINGGAAWGNKAYNIIILNRLKETSVEYDRGRGDDVEISVCKVKKRHHGKLGKVTMMYHIPTGRFSESVSYNPTGFGNYKTIISQYESIEAERQKAIEPQQSEQVTYIEDEGDFNMVGDRIVRKKQLSDEEIDAMFAFN